MTKVAIDMNTVEFQQSMFKLEKVEQRTLLNTLHKMSQLTWGDLYVDKGIRWEEIIGKKSETGQCLYSFRFSRKYRGVAYRKENSCILLETFPDHDGAYD